MDKCSENHFSSTPMEEAAFNRTFVPFNHKSSHHRKELLCWCQANWDSTFKKSLQSSNPLFYHDCCSSFSRRGFAKLAGHPPLQSSSVLRIPTFKNVKSADQLYQWLINMFVINSNRGQRSYFPTINRYHVEEDIQEVELDDEEPIFLKKRVENLCDNIQNIFTKRIAELEQVNQKLLCSSKSWCQKYQELLDKQENQIPVEFETPFKKSTKCFGLLNDD